MIDMVFLVLLFAIVAFVLIILFFTWYYKVMCNLIFGRMNGMLENIIGFGVPPVQWHRRMKKLDKIMGNVNLSAQRKNSAIDKHRKFVELSIKDMCAYARGTVFLADEYERQEAVYALERFRDETIYNLNEQREMI